MTYMLTNNEDDIANAWKSYAGYTIRPVASTINYYHQQVSNLSPGADALLFGSTPEIRSIFQILNKPLDIMDQSILMTKAMGRLTEGGHPIAKNENVFHQEWLSCHQLACSYDMLLGDDAINMLAYEDFDTFLKVAHRLLRNDGVFVCHLLVKPDDELIAQSVNTIMDEYLSGRINNIYDLASRLNFICYDQQSFRMGWQQTIKQLGSYLESIKPHFDFVRQFQSCNSYFTCIPQACFEDMVSPYFTIREIFYPHEYDYCQFEPIYLLQKKGQ